MRGDWMDNYLGLLRWTEGHDLDLILAGKAEMPQWKMRAVAAQVELLEDLKKRGMLVAYFYNGYDSGGRRSFEDM